MSSDQDSYYSPERTRIYYGSDPESSDTRRLRPPGQPSPQTVTISDQNGYSYPQLPQSLDAVGNSLEAHDVEDTNFILGPNYPLPFALPQGPGVGGDATYVNDHVPFHPFVNLPFYPYSESDHEHTQHQRGYIPYYLDYDTHTQPLVHDAHQGPVQNIGTSQTSQAPLLSVDLCSSSMQQLFLNRGEPMLGTRAAGTTPNGLKPDGANTATATTATTTSASAGQHSHPSPVEVFSNQTSTPSPSRPLPSSSDRKRPLPWSTDEHSERRVLPRHDRAWSVHPASSSPTRSRSDSNVRGRGPLIPQERYTTSTISLYNTPNSHPRITFNLENPDQIGIAITDILNKTGGFDRLRDRTEAFNMEKKTFTLRVQWPGYKPWSKTIAALDWTKHRAPVTRVKLAEAVATAIRGLLEQYHGKSYDPDCTRWNVGPNGIQLDQICLVALHHVSKGSWQPELCLLEPHL